MGRHRHVTCVRSDGLSAVLRPLLDDRRIVAATLVDVDSGLVLDGYSDDADLADLELLGAGHAEMVRIAGALAGAGGPDAELTVGVGDDRFHLLHAVPDPHGDRLVLAVVVRGARSVRRARRRLRTVSVAALTAGPTLSRRPVDGVWVPSGPDPAPESAPPGSRTDGDGVDVSAASHGEGGDVPTPPGQAWFRPPSSDLSAPAPPAAMPSRASGPAPTARPSSTVSAAAAGRPEESPA